MCAYWASRPRSMTARVPATSAALATSAIANEAARRRDRRSIGMISSRSCAFPPVVRSTRRGLFGLRCREARTLTSLDHCYGHCLIDRNDALGCHDEPRAETAKSPVNPGLLRHPAMVGAPGLEPGTR